MGTHRIEECTSDVLTGLIQIFFMFETRIVLLIYFRYLQLRHAAEAQLGLQGIHFQTSKLESVSLQPTHTTLIFGVFGDKSSKRFMVQDQWNKGVPNLSDQDWQEFFTVYFDKTI